MKYDLTAHIKAQDGKDMVDDMAADKGPVTVKTVFVRSLFSEYSADSRPVPPEEKLKRYRLWQKIDKSGDEIELTLEEAQTLKTCAAAYGTFLYGQLNELLNGGLN